MTALGNRPGTLAKSLRRVARVASHSASKSTSSRPSRRAGDGADEVLDERRVDLTDEAEHGARVAVDELRALRVGWNPGGGASVRARDDVGQGQSLGQRAPERDRGRGVVALATEHHGESLVLLGQRERDRAADPAFGHARRGRGTSGCVKTLPISQSTTSPVPRSRFFPHTRTSPVIMVGAKHGLVRGQRIRDAHPRDARAQEVEVAVAAQRRRPALDGPQVDDDVAQVTAELLSFAQSTRLGPRRRVSR